MIVSRLRSSVVLTVKPRFYAAKTAQKPKKGHAAEKSFQIDEYPEIPRKTNELPPSAPEFITRMERDSISRYDMDGRSTMFGRFSAEKVPIGSIVLVEQLLSKTRGTKQNTVGILTKINHKGGIGTTFAIRTYVLKVGVEYTYPLYSPMITKIKVLKRADPLLFTENDFKNIREAPKKTVDKLILKLEGMVDQLSLIHKKPPAPGPSS